MDLYAASRELNPVTAAAIADVEQQRSLRVNEREPKYRERRNNGFGLSVSVGLSHAKVAREKKPAPAPIEAPPIASPPIAKVPSPIGRFIRDYAEIVELCRAQADKLEISRHEIDRLAGLPEGHSGHVLAPSFSKLIGPAYLLALFETLGIRLVAIEDPELVARTLARRTPRQSSHMRQPRLTAPPAA
jgi:hypothetical protein